MTHSALAGTAVVLIGPRGAGKTTTGRILAQTLGFGFVDGDEALAAKVGQPAGQYLAAVGEAAFRATEAAVTVPALASAQSQVVALGGGAVTVPEVRTALQRPGLFVVFLHAPGDVLLARLLADPVARPSLTGLPLRAEIEALLAARLPVYRALAHAEIDAAAAPTAVAAAIAAAFTARRERLR
jgi:shikimate kinase